MLYVFLAVYRLSFQFSFLQFAVKYFRVHPSHTPKIECINKVCRDLQYLYYLRADTYHVDAGSSESQASIIFPQEHRAILCSHSEDTDHQCSRSSDRHALIS